MRNPSSAERRAVRLGHRTPVPRGHRRAPEPDASVLLERHRDAVERAPVVDAPAAGLAHPVRRHEADARGPGALEHGRVRGRTAEQDRGEGAQRVERGPAGVEQAQELGRDERGVRRAGAGGRLRERLGTEALAQVHHGGGCAGAGRAQQHLQPGDVVGGQREQPPAGRTDAGVRRVGRGPQRVGGQQDGLRGAGGAGGGDHRGDAVVDGREQVGGRGRVPGAGRQHGRSVALERRQGRGTEARGGVRAPVGRDGLDGAHRPRVGG